MADCSSIIENKSISESGIALRVTRHQPSTSRVVRQSLRRVSVGLRSAILFVALLVSVLISASCAWAPPVELKMSLRPSSVRLIQSKWSAFGRRPRKHSIHTVGRTALNYRGYLFPQRSHEFRLTMSATSHDSLPSKTSAELADERNRVAAAKRAARANTLQETRDRNFKLKRMMHTEAGATNDSNHPNATAPLYAVKVSVCEELRTELHLNGREKRGRVFIGTDTPGTQTLGGLKFEIHAFFRCLRKSTYTLQACLPIVVEDGSVLSPSDVSPECAASAELWPIESDEDVRKTFEAADQFFESNPNLKRPSILVHVSKDPNAPPPPPPPAYLKDMPDPTESESMTMLSFYAFPPEGIADPEEFATRLKKTYWKPFGNVVGRVYVATEGVNAQMAVPTNVMDHFMECCRSIPELGMHMENGINIDPKPLLTDEFQVAGVPINGKPAPPFRNLHIRVRQQVVADGLDKSLDWQKAGYDMPPLEWHAKVKEAREKKKVGVTDDDDIPLILDCRNNYETSVGRFEGAEPLETENFRESWDVLKERLADTPKDSPIMTYCTGGIRCVKVGAYLTQELGFTNVSRLAGGIIAYDRTLNEKAQDEEPMFKGTNFVFDGRMGREITDDGLAECITCGEKTSLVTNCKNENCHRRMIQCEKCRTAYMSTCSDACKQRVLNGAMVGRKKSASNERQSSSTDKGVYHTLDEYSTAHSSPPSDLYREIERNTEYHLKTGAHMVSGAAQGRLLTQLASMTRSGRILELGTFTGYATACFLEGAANAGEALSQMDGNRQSGPFVMTLERDSRAINLAASHLKIMAEFGIGPEAAEESQKLRGESNNLPEVGDDVVSCTFNGIAGCELVRVTDALAIVEAMAGGTSNVQPGEPFDFVFVDADKTRLLDYVEACLSSDRVLKKGGLIVVDNVLWKGLVLGASAGDFGPEANPQDGLESDEMQMELKKSRRARKLANVMHTFNSAIIEDPRVEVVLLPMRDGLSIIRKL